MLYLMLGLLLAVATMLGALILWVEKQEGNSPNRHYHQNQQH